MTLAMSTTRKRSTLWAGFVFFVMQITTHLAQAQDITVVARLDTQQATIGQVVALEVQATAREKFDLIFPTYPDTLRAGLHVVNETEVQALDEGNLYIQKKTYNIFADDAKFFSIRPIPLILSTQSRNDTLLSNSLALKVQNPIANVMQAEPQKQKPNKQQPMNFAEFTERFWPYMVGLAVLGGIAFLLWYLRKKKQGQTVATTEQKPQWPAHVIAMQQLEALEKKKLWQKNQGKAYFTELTDILRNYIWQRMGVHTLERTSAEIIEAMRHRPELSPDDFANLSAVLRTADMVKFAKYKPVPDQYEQALEQAKALVKHTAFEQNNKQTQVEASPAQLQNA